MLIDGKMSHINIEQTSVLSDVSATLGSHRLSGVFLCQLETGDLSMLGQAPLLMWQKPLWVLVTILINMFYHYEQFDSGKLSCWIFWLVFCRQGLWDWHPCCSLWMEARPHDSVVVRRLHCWRAESHACMHAVGGCALSSGCTVTLTACACSQAGQPGH